MRHADVRGVIAPGSHPHARARHAGRVAAFAALVLAAALLPRLWHPSPFVTWDEPVWTYRSMKFVRALQVGDPGGTALTDHPGVPTMWAGGAGIAVRAALSPEAGRDLRWVDDLPAFDEDDTALLASIMPWWPAARAGLAVLTGLLLAVAVALVRRLTDARTALLATVLMAFDPWLLGHSRLLQLDAVLAETMLLSLLCLGVALRSAPAARSGARGAWRWATIAAGAFAGVAALEKSPALFVAPFTLLTVGACAVRADGWRASAASATVRAMAWWALGAAAAYVALWPAMWLEPLRTLAGMWAYAAQSAGGAREAVFFRGAVGPDPGVALYVAALAWRLTPMAALGAIAALAALRAPRFAARSLVALLLAFGVLYTMFMGTSAKKFERYVLPVVPALDVAAAIGLARLADPRRARGADGASAAAAPQSGRVVDVAASDADGRAADAPGVAADRRRVGARHARAARATGVATIVLLGIQTLAIARHAPYYLAWYDPLLGGGSAAATVLPVGWGEGMDRAAAALNALPGASELTVATPSVALLAPLFHGRTVRARDRSDADLVVLYVDDVQIGRPELVRELHGRSAPLHVVRINGIDYAWVYSAGAP